MVVVEVVAMPLGRIQAAARRSDDLTTVPKSVGNVVDHQSALQLLGSD